MPRSTTPLLRCLSWYLFLAVVFFNSNVRLSIARPCKFCKASVQRMVFDPRTATGHDVFFYDDLPVPPALVRRRALVPRGIEDIGRSSSAEEPPKAKSDPLPKAVEEVARSTAQGGRLDPQAETSIREMTQHVKYEGAAGDVKPGPEIQRAMSVLSLEDPMGSARGWPSSPKPLRTPPPGSLMEPERWRSPDSMRRLARERMRRTQSFKQNLFAQGGEGSPPRREDSELTLRTPPAQVSRFHNMKRKQRPQTSEQTPSITLDQRRVKKATLPFYRQQGGRGSSSESEVQSLPNFSEQPSQRESEGRKDSVGPSQ